MSRPIPNLPYTTRHSQSALPDVSLSCLATLRFPRFANPLSLGVVCTNSMLARNLEVCPMVDGLKAQDLLHSRRFEDGGRVESGMPLGI